MITIRHATLCEKYKTYEWLYRSDTTILHQNLPGNEGNPIPDFEQFQQDFEDFYYLPESQHLGSVLIISNGAEEVGCICYACFHLRENTAELDIWMNSTRHLGKGYGPRAIRLLIDYLKDEKDIKRFLIRPSEHNIRAIRSYEKAGFRRAEDKKATLDAYYLPEYINLYGDGDYGMENTAVLILD